MPKIQRGEMSLPSPDAYGFFVLAVWEVQF